MKNFIEYLKLGTQTVLICLIITSCDLVEDPPELAPRNAFVSEEGTSAALNGVFNAMGAFQQYGADYHHITNFSSGLFMSGRPSDRVDIAALEPTPSQTYVGNFWRQSYTSILRANFIITNTDPETDNDNIKNLLGIAYFLRAHNYFNLVRIYGGVPLYEAPANVSTLNLPRSSAEVVYDLIIEDAQKAEEFMYGVGEQTGGRPTKFAANMLLAKVYMTLAGNDNASPYWAQAQTEALKVYGNFSLVEDYMDLWDDISTANNNSESIFELQFNEENANSLVRLFTDGNAYPGPGWSRIRPNPETIDMHTDRYPGDPRIQGTFVTSFVHHSNGNLIRRYPENSSRGWFGAAFPYIYKYWVKDTSMASFTTNFNYVHYRYADLLLMLAEIENEINGPTNAYQYVNEVLERARNSAGGSVEPANWSGLSQDDFRTAIMREYHYELLGEGQDFFVSRRRGYQFFKTNYIDVHNAFPNLKGFDAIYPDDDKIMLMPIPSSEINFNENINESDQNPGY